MPPTIREQHGAFTETHRAGKALYVMRLPRL